MGIDLLGKWPMSGRKARQKPSDIHHIDRLKMLRIIHGREHPVQMLFYVSNDYMHVGEFTIPSGDRGVRATEPETHKGDEALYVVEGPITVFLPDTGEAWEVNEEQLFYIPAQTRHQSINYTNKVVKALFCIAPEL